MKKSTRDKECRRREVRPSRCPRASRGPGTPSSEPIWSGAAAPAEPAAALVANRAPEILSRPFSRRQDPYVPKPGGAAK